MNKYYMRKDLFSVLALGLMAAPAFAIEVNDTSRVVDLDEVLVVSQPKESYALRLQPLSSTVMGTEQIQNLGLRDLRDVSEYVPSFVMPNYGSRYTSSMYVRGIGSRVNSPAVGIYVDNIPMVNKSMFNFHTYELQRLDVLRGPQGTLYGQNTEGGLVRMYSRSPLIYQGTDVKLGFGTGLYRKAEVAHYGKLSDRLGYSVAAFYNGQQGFFDNQSTGDHADEMNEGGGKLHLQWQATDRLLVDVLADYQYVKQNGFPYGQLDADDRAAEPNTNRQGTYSRHMLTTGLGLTYKGDWADLNYTASWQYLNDDMLMDIDYRPLDYMHMEQAQLQNALTQELTLKSNTQGRWHWTTGAYYAYQALKTNAPVYFDEEMNKYLSKTIEDYAYYGMLNSMAKRMGEQAAAAMIARAGGCHITLNMATIPGLFRTPQHNFALFHESNIELTPRLTATLGLRYDVTQTALDYRTVGEMQLNESVMGTQVNAHVISQLAHEEQNNFDQWLPKFGLTYRIDNHNSNVYAQVAKGYRAGGFNFQMFSDVLQSELQGVAQRARGDMELQHDEAFYDNIRNTISYKPEESWNYEFGTHLNLFDNKLHVDLAGYYMQIRNQQLSVMATQYGFGRAMVNAGRSYSCGIEASLRGSALDDHLTWAVNYGYTRAVFKEYTDSVTVAGQLTAVSYKDKRVPFIPEHTLSACADYRIDFGGTLRSITIGANAIAQGKTYWDTDNLYSQKLYATLGAHVDADFGLLSLSLWGRNLTGTNYNTFAIESPMAGTTNYYAHRGNPRQMGIDLRLHF